jgi:hypothetical protein
MQVCEVHRTYRFGTGFVEVSRSANEQCLASQEVFDRCLLWGDKNDFIQYYLGGFIYNSQGNPGTTTTVQGTDSPYTGLAWNLNGADSANNQNHAASFITTSSVLPKSTYPQFTSDGRANYAVAGGRPPFEPYDGSWYWYSQQADVSYKRLMRPFTMPTGGGDMTFRFSYDTEPDWDFVFVEIHNITDNTWRTAPDLNGHTTNDTGLSCPEGWHELHPWLEQYQGAPNPSVGFLLDDGAGRWLLVVDFRRRAGHLLATDLPAAAEHRVYGVEQRLR